MAHLKTQKGNLGNKDGGKGRNSWKTKDVYKDVVLSKVNKPISRSLNGEYELKDLKSVIAHEFIQASPDSIVQLLLDIINNNMEIRRMCKEWCTGVISLIQKEGPMVEPNILRGICLMNLLMKTLYNTQWQTHYICQDHDFIIKD